MLLVLAAGQIRRRCARVAHRFPEGNRTGFRPVRKDTVPRTRGGRSGQWRPGVPRAGAVREQSPRDRAPRRLPSQRASAKPHPNGIPLSAGTKVDRGLFPQAAALRRTAPGHPGRTAYPDTRHRDSGIGARTRGFRAGAPAARRKESSGPPRILHTQGSEISAATPQMACTRGFRAGAPAARRKGSSGPPRILHTQGAEISAATPQMAGTRGFRAGAPAARRKESSGPPRILHTQGSEVFAATPQMACLRENRTEACRHRCVAWSSKPMCGSDVTGRFDSCTLPPIDYKGLLCRPFPFQAT